MSEKKRGDWAATGVRGYGPERAHAWPEYGAAPPVGPVTPEASELERYLSGLFGPKAPK
jgi:hypothetical protein